MLPNLLKCMCEKHIQEIIILIIFLSNFSIYADNQDLMYTQSIETVVNFYKYTINSLNTFKICHNSLWFILLLDEYSMCVAHTDVHTNRYDTNKYSL